MKENFQAVTGKNQNGNLGGGKHRVEGGSPEERG